MSKLEWNAVGERVFESGLSHGVLYLTNGRGVAWNGLRTVTELKKRKVSPIYFDGVKIADRVKLGEFAGNITAFTYPDEFAEYEGLEELVAGVSLAEQQPKKFGLSYRTRVGNDVDGADGGYKIHIIYNVTAIPSNKRSSTINSSTDPYEFSWAISAVPEYTPNFRPTSHIIIDSRKVNANLLADVELLLYGGETADPQLPAFSDLIDMFSEYYEIELIDNNDGTWMARTDKAGYIKMLTDDEFRISDIEGEFLDADTYTISSTR